MIEPCCDVKIKHSRYKVKANAKPKRPCCSKIFKNLKSSKHNNVVVSKHSKSKTKRRSGGCGKSNRKTKKKK